jgi:hypothetical protein
MAQQTGKKPNILFIMVIEKISTTGSGTQLRRGEEQALKRNSMPPIAVIAHGRQR